MSPLLIALLGALLIPLFVGTWRMSLLGLAGQGLLMGWIAYRITPDVESTGSLLRLFDLFIVRGVVAPIALYRVLRSQHAPARNDLIPPNLFSWTVALGSVLLAFNFSSSLVPEAGESRTLVSVATTGVLLGFLVLATRVGHFSQMVGALRIENAITLFSLGLPTHNEVVPLDLAEMLVVIATIISYRYYLIHLPHTPADAHAPVTEEPTL